MIRITSSRVDINITISSLNTDISTSFLQYEPFRKNLEVNKLFSQIALSGEHPDRKELTTIRINRLLLLLPLGMWVVLIFLLSSQSYEKQSIRPFLYEHFDQQTVRQYLPDVSIHYRTSNIHAKTAPFHFIEFVFRKSAHVLVYTVLAALSYVAMLPYRNTFGWKYAAVLLFAAAVAMLDEWNQSITPQRTSAIQDVGIDMSGAVLGLCLAILLHYGYKWIRGGK